MAGALFDLNLRHIKIYDIASVSSNRIMTGYHKKKLIIPLITSVGLILFMLLLTSCFPGPGVYDEHITGEHVVVLPEGPDYVVYFEAILQGETGGGSSSTSRASKYPELDGIVVVRDEDGNTIPNTIASGELYSYSSGDRWGMTVARFELEGKGTRSVELHTDMGAYRRFMNTYSRPGGPFVGQSAPNPVSRVVIREVSGFMMWQSALIIILFVFIACGIVGYLIYRIRYRKERSRSRQAD